MRIAFILVISAVLITSASAGGVPFGADGLPYLVANSDVIIQSDGCEITERTPYRRVCDVHVKAVVRGDLEHSGVVKVLLSVAGRQNNDAKGDPTDEIAWLRNATLFLTKPLTVGQLADYKVRDMASSIRALVSNSAVISSEDKVLQSSVSSYLKANTNELRLEWAKSNLKSSDKVLQRWALFEIE
jgi:hypothetical protein